MPLQNSKLYHYTNKNLTLDTLMHYFCKIPFTLNLTAMPRSSSGLLPWGDLAKNFYVVPMYHMSSPSHPP